MDVYSLMRNLYIWVSKIYGAPQVIWGHQPHRCHLEININKYASQGFYFLVLSLIENEQCLLSCGNLLLYGWAFKKILQGK